ncbi:hypothetical protein VTN00DRAFT_1219 [Thermoascus crustaceus]|uniref:uncharacterized protein n=1 Tax=Thermoascus crustaceus TaxID=5088 RepID=UPI003743A434
MGKSALWYCCKCNYGPHEPAIHAACIDCGAERCHLCRVEVTKTAASRDCDPISPYPSAPIFSPRNPENDVTTFASFGNGLPSVPDRLSVNTVLLSRSLPTEFSAPVRTHGPTYMYICCNCGDGPKVYKNQPRCIMCEHTACENCEQVK